ncbi:Zinc finger RING-type [Trinorchestia longiramus]|nr:Zinc finger RING-type [Trinorchestia longiramus]
MPTTIPMGGLGLTLLSCFLTASVIANAYYQKKQFYPSVVYIMKSNPSIAALYLMAFTLALLLGKLLKKIFFGTLRVAESEHLIERFFYAITETCLAFTVFRDDFSHKFVALFTVLLFLKAFHWLADYRVDYMERSPIITRLFHIRIASLLVLLSTIDILLVRHAYYSTMTMGATVQLVFGFEYAILLTVAYNIGVKYICHGIDLHRENPWENKAMYLLYTELFVGFIKVLLYMIFLVIMLRIHTFPLFIIRPMYLTMKAFKKALQDMLQSRRAIHNMNTLYPDATADELQQADNVCIICREEMVVNSGVKKLPCNHLFHALCLRSWFQRQQTCPTCRLDVLRPTLAAAAAARAATAAAAPAAPADQQQPQVAPANMVEFFQQVAEQQERARQHNAARAPQQTTRSPVPGTQQPPRLPPPADQPPIPFPPVLGAPFPGFLPPPFPAFPLLPPEVVQRLQQQTNSSTNTTTTTTTSSTTTTEPTSGSTTTTVQCRCVWCSAVQVCVVQCSAGACGAVQVYIYFIFCMLTSVCFDQLTQYQQVMARLDIEYPLPPSPPVATASPTAASASADISTASTAPTTAASTAATPLTSTPVPRSPSVTGASSGPIASSSNTSKNSLPSSPINSSTLSSPSSAASDAETPEEVRRRRLERFASNTSN